MGFKLTDDSAKIPNYIAEDNNPDEFSIFVESIWLE